MASPALGARQSQASECKIATLALAMAFFIRFVIQSD